MSDLPNRFGYRTKSEPNMSTYFDCLEISMSDGVLSVDVGVQKKNFQLDDLSWFDFSMGHKTMLAVIARANIELTAARYDCAKAAAEKSNIRVDLKTKRFLQAAAKRKGKKAS